jgi:myosin-5
MILNFTRKFNQRVTLIQCLYRKKKAKRILLALRAEARSLNHIKEVKYKLENKVVELTQQVQGFKELVKSLREENKILQEKLDSKTNECLDLKQKGDKSRKELSDSEVKIKTLVDIISSKDQEIEKLKISGNGELKISLNKSQDTINDLKEQNKKLKEKYVSSLADSKHDTVSDTAPSSRRNTFSSKDTRGISLKTFTQSDSNGFINPILSAIRKVSNASTIEIPSSILKRSSVEEPPSPIKSNPNTVYSSQVSLYSTIKWI